MTAHTKADTRERTVSKARSRVVIAALTLASVIIGVAGVHAGSLPLQWDAPTTNVDGTPLSDLASYRIYLGTTTPTCPSASFHTITAPAATPTVGEIVASRIVGLVAGTTYFARVTAVDVAGNESGCSGSATGAAVAEFSVAPGAATSFGSAVVGTTVDRTFTVQNTSTASLSGSVSVGAPYTVTSGGGSFTLAPGATRTVTVQFAPTAPGSFAGNVNFTAGGDVVSRSVNGSATASAVTLNVAKAGTGAGTVTSVPAGIACGADCSESVAPGTQLTLTASPSTGSTFAGWSGACSGTGTCAVTVNAATSVTATFTTMPVTLTVAKAGTGAGAVNSTPAGIACGADCSESVVPGTQLTLTASPSIGSTFTGWSGGCTGTGACTVSVSAATMVTATFEAAPVMLTVSKAGTGAGSVSSTPVGITCGADCSESVTPGSQLTLTATTTTGSTFTGWSGACSGTGTCTVTMSAARTVTATFTLTPVTLSVTKSGAGAGTVSSAPAGITCGADCSESVAPGAQLTLTASPATGSTFAGWSGGCSGTGTCTVTVNAATAVTATFNLVPMTLSLTKNGSGTGTVTSAPAGIACGTDCSETVAPGTQLALTASAASGSTFAGWSGACSNTGTCTVTVNAATAVTATFNLVPVTLSVARSGSGSGTVTSAPAGIACGADCSEAVAPGTQLTLTATAASGSTFAGWSGSCSGTGSCTVTVNAAASVTATFILAPVTLSVTKGGTGSGTVTSLPAGIACGADCSETVPPGTSLTLTATPDTGSVFSGWAGACSGTGACTVAMSAARAVTATFGPAGVDRTLQASPAPVVRDLSPSWATAGTTGLTLTVEGRGFVAGSRVHWNGAPRATSFVDARHLRAVITTDDLASARMATVSVFTPAPGGGLSQSARFIVAPSFTTSTSRDGDIVIDNAEPGVQDATRSYTGTWCRAQTSARFGASSLLACGSGIDAYRWTPQIPASGTYEVYIWVAGSRELSSSVPFVVTHAGGTTVRTLDQQNGRGRWVLHGRYVFQTGTAGYVEARSNSAQTEGGPAGADAVRFVRRR